MRPLYNISFSQGAIVSKYDDKGNIVTQSALQKPITIKALPYKTAMRYSGNAGFTMERFVFENQGDRSKKKNRKGIGNATQEVDFDAAAIREEIEKEHQVDVIHEAAKSGDMTAAINA